MAISSAFERTLIYRIVSYRIVYHVNRGVLMMIMMMMKKVGWSHCMTTCCTALPILR